MLNIKKKKTSVTEDFTSMLSGTTMTVVGRHAYQSATLAADEEIYLLREPNNPYDANAIGVFKSDGEPIGHIGRAMAAVLATEMKLDEKWWGSVCGGHTGRWKCSVLMK
jgi:SWI/SNF-related matrix-associated actin-dependent regulator of chromatin subfamily A3